jgi:hypothetical protein
MLWQVSQRLNGLLGQASGTTEGQLDFATVLFGLGLNLVHRTMGAAGVVGQLEALTREWEPRARKERIGEVH